MRNLLRDLRADVSGASAAEYALLIALIGGVIIVSLSTVAPPINQVFNSMSAQLINAKNHLQ